MKKIFHFVLALIAAFFIAVLGLLSNALESRYKKG